MAMFWQIKKCRESCASMFLIPVNRNRIWPHYTMLYLMMKLSTSLKPLKVQQSQCHLCMFIPSTESNASVFGLSYTRYSMFKKGVGICMKTEGPSYSSMMSVIQLLRACYCFKQRSPHFHIGYKILSAAGLEGKCHTSANNQKELDFIFDLLNNKTSLSVTICVSYTPQEPQAVIIAKSFNHN